MRIKIDDTYSITTDENNYILCKPRDGMSNGKKITRNEAVSYHHDVAGCLAAYSKIVARASQATSFAEYIKDLNKIQAVLAKINKEIADVRDNASQPV